MGYIFGNAFAQNLSFEGQIVDSNNNPITQVSIFLTNVKKYIKSNKLGYFSFNSEIGSEIKVSAIGFLEQKIILSNPNFKIVLKEITDTLPEFITLGTRRLNRIKLESVVPIDVIKFSDVGISTARVDLASNLNYAVPSFNYVNQVGSDGGDHIDLATLRGLGTDHTLVLIDNIRRHPTAFVAVLGVRGRANSGIDFNAFPAIAVNKIEVLKDAATAQYGSDAIAGVINIGLKKNTDKWDIVLDYSGYYDYDYNSVKFNQNNDFYTSGSVIDGQTIYAGINKGWKLGKRGGFINLSFEYLNQEKTFRAPNPKDSILNYSRLQRAFGNGSVEKKSFFYNMEIPLSLKHPALIFYGFGGLNNKVSNMYGFTRFYTAGGSTSRFPVNPSGEIIFDPKIMRRTNDGSYLFYNPQYEVRDEDYSNAVGIKGITKSDWNWNVSSNIGYNNFNFFGVKTYNASIIGQTTPNNFNDGGFNLLQWTSNIDFSKFFGNKLKGKHFNIAFGSEIRYEKYQIYKGENLSWQIVPNNFNLNQAAGSQGFPGYQPSDEVTANRTNIGFYGDFEWNPFKIWTLDFAIRGENYSDFGSLVTYKFASLVKVSPFVNIRGSISSGYRAPSLAQIYYSNTLTTLNKGVLSVIKFANNRDPLAQLAGIPSMKQETSLNFSLGTTWQPLKNLNISLDGYLIKMYDRIILTGYYNSSNTNLPAPFLNAIIAANVNSVQFFTNALNATNYGMDITADYFLKIDHKNSLKFLIAANFQNINIDKVNIPKGLSGNGSLDSVFFSPREQYYVKASAPDSKIIFTVEYNLSKLGLGIRATRFGMIQIAGYGQDGINLLIPTDANPNITVPDVINLTPKLVLDFYARYQVAKILQLNVGVDNVLNTHPDYSTVANAQRAAAGNNDSGGAWESAQMGFNGLRFFSKLVFSF